MRSLIMLILFLLAATCCETRSASAQEDPIESAQTYPPRLFGKEQNETHLATINWKLELKENVLRNSKERIDIVVDAMKRFSEKLEALNADLPVEVRFVDKEVRSQLIGKMMVELLNARLDLASRESSVAVFEELLVEATIDKRVQLSKRNSEIAIQAASAKVKVARIEYEKTQQLHSKGSKSNSDKLMAQYTFEIAKMELEKANLDAEIEDVQQYSEIAQRLTETRIEIEPIKARIATAEKLLKAFVDSSKIFAEIEETQRGLDRTRDGLLDWFSEMAEVEREVEKLQILKSRIESGVKKMESEPKDSAKDE